MISSPTARMASILPAGVLLGALGLRDLLAHHVPQAPLLFHRHQDLAARPVEFEQFVERRLGVCAPAAQGVADQVGVVADELDVEHCVSYWPRNEPLVSVRPGAEACPRDPRFVDHAAVRYRTYVIEERERGDQEIPLADGDVVGITDAPWVSGGLFFPCRVRQKRFHFPHEIDAGRLVK